MQDPQPSPLKSSPVQNSSPSHPQPQTPPSSSPDPLRRVYEEFDDLSKKAYRIYNYLGQLPPIGAYWQPYFDQAFNVYSKLWKMQQQFRSALEGRGFQRWEVGELAARIAQLYYFYYLRTSDNSYLQESFTFYNAIRQRSYFATPPPVTGSPGSLTKPHSIYQRNFRYHARFLIVCLFLGSNRKVIEEIIDSMKLLMLSFIRETCPSKAEVQQWQVLLDEIKTFCAYYMPLKTSPDLAERPECLSSRLNISYLSQLQAVSPISMRKPDRTSRLRLNSALIVGNRQPQVKFSELTLDMLQIMHALEYQPATQSNQPATFLSQDGEMMLRNPRKYLLYRATSEQLLYYIATLHSELQQNRVLMLYITANHCGPTLEGDATGAELFMKGGLAMFTDSNTGNRTQQLSGMAPLPAPSATPSTTFCPGDLLPFMRKPLFIVLDSDNCTPFKDIPLIYTEPFLCLMSPPSLDESKRLPLANLFLGSPIAAFCVACGVESLSTGVFLACTDRIVTLFQNLTQLLFDSEAVVPACFLRFMEDDFISSMVLRFIFCHTVYSLLSSNQHEPQLPSSHPSLPPAILNSTLLRHAVRDLATLVGKPGVFIEPATVVDQK